MRAHRLSMSKVDMSKLCAYWARADVPYVDSVSGLPARIGTGTHLLAEHWYYGRPVPALDDDVAEDAKKIFARLVLWLGARRERILMCEIGLRYNSENDTALVGPKRGEPGYEDVGAMVLPGTLDLVLRGEDGVLEIVDIKTGKKENAHAEQLHAQAVAATRHFGENKARIGFVFPRKTKCDEPEWEPLDANRLDREAGRIHRTLKMIPTAQPNSGDWCFRCSLRGECPAWKTNAA